MGAAASGEMARAAVLVGRVETTYRRAGRGRAVIVLMEVGADAGTQLAPLVAKARVILPDTTSVVALGRRPGARPPLATWLRDFLEGLGIASATVIASAECRDELASLPGDGSGSVTDLLLVEPGPVNWQGVADRLPG